MNTSVVVERRDGSFVAGLLTVAGPSGVTITLADGRALVVPLEDIASVEPKDKAATGNAVPPTATATPVTPPPRQGGPPTSITDVLVNRIVVVRTRDHRVDGMLTSAGPDGVVLKTAHGDEIVDRADITSIERTDGGGPSWEVDDSEAPAKASSREAPQHSSVDPYEREKRSEQHERDGRIADLEKQASDHATAAWSWYLGAGSGCLTSVALLGIWAFIVASPACLIGAGVGVVGAAVFAIIGLTETGAEMKAKNDAHAMAY
jgi:hypothetical protein